jgi:protein-disulfide isomerase
VKLSKVVTTSALAVAMASQALFADTTPAAQAVSSASDMQKKEFEKVIHDYIVNNPEVLLEASQALQQKQQQNVQQQAQAAIKEQAPQLFDAKLAVLGNPNGNVTIVEFFDYQCIHCKNMAPVLKELMSKNNNLRIVYKEFPIFGKSSEFASKVAIAAAMQGKYAQVHEALLKVNKKLTDELVLSTAKSAGVDMNKLKADMKSKTVEDVLADNKKLAEKLRLMGTPAFIVAATPDNKFKADSEASFIPGAASAESLQELIKKHSPA